MIKFSIKIEEVDQVLSLFFKAFLVSFLEAILSSQIKKAVEKSN